MHVNDCTLTKDSLIHQSFEITVKSTNQVILIFGKKYAFHYVFNFLSTEIFHNETFVNPLGIYANVGLIKNQIFTTSVCLLICLQTTYLIGKL